MLLLLNYLKLRYNAIKRTIYGRLRLNISVMVRVFSPRQIKSKDLVNQMFTRSFLIGSTKYYCHITLPGFLSGHHSGNTLQSHPFLELISWRQPVLP